MVQASLAPLLFAGGTSVCDLRGGTDVIYSPPLDFLMCVLRPTLAKMGACFDVECSNRGFYPLGGGRVKLTVSPVPGTLKAIILDNPGKPLQVRATLYSTNHIGQDEALALDAVKQILRDLAPKIQVRCTEAPAQ